jgi:hypothetical protein
MSALRSDRVVRVLTRVVSIGYTGLLVLGIIVLVGLPAVKLAAGDSPDWMLGLTVPVVSLESAATVQTRWGDAQLEVEDLRGALRLPVGILPWWLFMVLWGYVAVAMALVLGFLHQMRGIFQRARGGAPFDAANARRLHRMGLLALAFAALSGGAESLTALAVRGGVQSARLQVPLGLSVDGSVVFLGLVLLALAGIFRRGAELEAEQSLTV